MSFAMQFISYYLFSFFYENFSLHATIFFTRLLLIPNSDWWLHWDCINTKCLCLVGTDRFE